MKSKKNNLLIVAAHPDDEIIGCGGTILKLKKNYNIEAIFMTDGISSRYKKNTPRKKIKNRREECLRVFKYLKIKKPTFCNFPDNQMDKVPLIEIVKVLEKKINKFKPNTIMTHFENCLNIDHRLTYQAVITAARPLKNSSVKKILSFEVPSSTDWALFSKKNFQPNYFVDISIYIKKKIHALKLYKSELKKYPHSRSIKNIKSLAQIRGTSCGVNYAEGFVMSRYIEK